MIANPRSIHFCTSHCGDEKRLWEQAHSVGKAAVLAELQATSPEEYAEIVMNFGKEVPAPGRGKKAQVYDFTKVSALLQKGKRSLAALYTNFTLLPTKTKSLHFLELMNLMKSAISNQQLRQGALCRRRAHDRG